MQGFLRIGDKRPGNAQNYWVQLRSARAQDTGLADSIYTPGVLIWFADEAYSSNRVAAHPGHGFIGVVDADQNVISRNGRIAKSAIQVSDATFGLYSQKGYSNDAYLQPVSRFDDRNDYSLSEQPRSGLVLPKHGLTIEVLEQSANSSKAKIRVAKSTNKISADFVFTANSETVSFRGQVSGVGSNVSYYWDFGDGNSSNELSPNHTYTAAGDYSVTLTISDGGEQQTTVTKTVQVAKSDSSTSTSNTANNTSASSGGGGGSSSLVLIILLMSAFVFRRRS